MESKSKLDPNTLLAIDAFKKVNAIETRLEKAKDELCYYACRIPDKDKAEYVRLTVEGGLK